MAGEIHYLPHDGSGIRARCIELARRMIGRIALVRVLVLGGCPWAWETRNVPETDLEPVPRDRIRYHAGYSLSELPELAPQAHLTNEPSDLEGSAAD